MADEAQYVSVGFPYAGVSCLPWRWRTEQGVRSPVAWNVDFTSGTVLPREGFTLLYSERGARCLGMDRYITSEGDAWLLLAMFNPTSWTTTIKAVDMDGNLIDTRSVHTAPAADMPDADNWYRFHQWGRAVYVLSDKGRGIVYYPEAPKGADRIKHATGTTSADGDFALDSPYFQQFPRVAASTMHADTMVFGGFDGRTMYTLSIAVPENSGYSITAQLRNARTQLDMFANNMIMSDPGNPDRVASVEFMSLPGGEKVKALASTRGGCLAMSEQNTYLIPQSLFSSGNALDPIVPLGDGIGCVHQRTVAKGRNMVAWMGHGGIYAYDDRGLRVISDDIADLWNPRGWRSFPMADIGGTAGDHGYPWMLQIGRLDRACGAYNEQMQAFWWAVPLAGFDDYNRLVLVYWPATGSWSFWMPDDAAGSEFRPTNMVSVTDGYRRRFFFADYNGAIYEYGTSPTDKDSNNADVAIKWAWQSPWLDQGPDGIYSTESLCVRHRTAGALLGVSGSDPGTPEKFYVDSDYTQGTDDHEPKDSGNLASSIPTKRTSTAVPEWTWNNGLWGSFSWHPAEVWRGRYRPGSLRGNAFRVGFGGIKTSSRDIEIFDAHLGIQPAGKIGV